MMGAARHDGGGSAWDRGRTVVAWIGPWVLAIGALALLVSLGGDSNSRPAPRRHGETIRTRGGAGERTSIRPRGTARGGKTSAGLSRILFPAMSAGLDFSHAAHLARGISCARCHHKPGQRARMTACAACHREAQIPKGFGNLGHRDTKPCRKCHQRFLASGFPVPGGFPRARIRFSHALHSKSVACKTCHGGLERSRSLGVRHVPRMAQCRSCHQRRKVADRCLTCHVRKDARHMRTVFPEGKLVPGPALGILAHGPGFRYHHRAAATSRPQACQSCHRRSECVACHAAKRRVVSIHPGNYLHRHGSDARARPGSCRTCHTRQRFCLDCHQRMGVAQSSPQTPYGGLHRRFHPPGWASSVSRSPSANEHALHAKRNMGTCVSCHRQSDCRRCHATTLVGGYGFSPHGPGFAGSRRCMTLRSRNRRVCLKCHMRGDPRLDCRK